MENIDPTPGSENNRRIMDLVLKAGQLLLESGAEVFRVEQTMQIMANSFRLQDFHVYVLSNGIFASAEDGTISEVRNIPDRAMHLGRVDAVNSLSRRIAAGEVTLEQAELQLKEAAEIPFPSNWGRRIGCSMGAFFLAVLFGGTLAEGVVAALAGFVLTCYLIWCDRRRVHSIFQKMTGSALASVCCLALCALLGLDANRASIGALMLLTPGVAFTMGIRDFANSDYLSGSIRMMDALLIGASIAGGSGLVMALYTHWMGGLP